MANSTSGILASVLALLTFAGMQVFRNQLASSQVTTILGGFAGSNVFLFLLTAVSNFEMEIFGGNFQAKLFPEVFGCLLIAAFASALVHRVCVTTCMLFSIVLLYYVNKISTSTYGSIGSNVQAANVSGKKKK